MNFLEIHHLNMFSTTLAKEVRLKYFLYCKKYDREVRDRKDIFKERERNRNRGREQESWREGERGSSSALE